MFHKNNTNTFRNKIIDESSAIVSILVSLHNTAANTSQEISSLNILSPQIILNSENDIVTVDFIFKNNFALNLHRICNKLFTYDIAKNEGVFNAADNKVSFFLNITPINTGKSYLYFLRDISKWEVKIVGDSAKANAVHIEAKVNSAGYIPKKYIDSQAIKLAHSKAIIQDKNDKDFYQNIHNKNKYVPKELGEKYMNNVNNELLKKLDNDHSIWGYEIMTLIANCKNDSTARVITTLSVGEIDENAGRKKELAFPVKKISFKQNADKGTVSLHFINAYDSNLKKAEMLLNSYRENKKNTPMGSDLILMPTELGGKYVWMAHTPRDWYISSESEIVKDNILNIEFYIKDSSIVQLSDLDVDAVKKQVDDELQLEADRYEKFLQRIEEEREYREQLSKRFEEIRKGYDY